MEKIAVIGGGPSGMIAAGIAASRGKSVTLFEKNERLGKKLFITGKGRCNITNASPIDEFFDFVVTNKRFLYSSFYSFTNEDIITLLEENGLTVKIERGNRVFPSSDKSSDVLKALIRFLNGNKVNIQLNTRIMSVEKKGDSFILCTVNKRLEFDKIIIATGGKSYPSTGSTGDGYNFAKMFGHSVTKLKPSLVPIEIDAKWIKDLQGLSLKNVELSAFNKNKFIHKEFGEMVFSHYGISGPIVLSMSNYIYEQSNNIILSLDFKPALSKEKLESRILRDFGQYKNKHINNALFELLPKKIIPWIILQSEINPEKPVNQITIEERSSLIEAIKGFKMKFKSFRPIEEAIVTSGGISTNEINPSTMESKLVANLYFTGEVIDVDALTGGYNLQIAYSTGYLAGINI